MTLEEQALKMWNDAQGTPESLVKAIRNGMDEIHLSVVTNKGWDPEEIILKHVKDFLSQKFTPFMAGDGSVPDCVAHALWDKVMGIK